MIMLTLLLACSGADKDTDTADTADSGVDTASDSGADSGADSGDTDTAPACGGTSPVIEGVRIENGGLYDFGGEEYPSAKLTVEMTDADGDLRPFQVQLWWDTAIDGVIDTATAEGLTMDPYILDGYADCEVTSVSFAITLQVDGGRFDYAVDYEFAAVVTDAAGLVSEPALGLGTMPNPDGSDGTGEP